MLQRDIVSNKTVVFVLFSLFACLFYADKILLGPYAPVRIHDHLDLEFARYRTSGNLLLQHGIFAWYPNAFCGMPSFAYQHPPYYLLSFFVLELPPWVLYHFISISLMVIAGFGMYWFLNDFLDIQPGLSFAGGIIFALYSQVQESALNHVVVFNYVFPAFFMCVVGGLFNNRALLLKTLACAFVFTILLISFPVLTFPVFFVLQLLVICLLGFQRRKFRMAMAIKTILAWAGYIAICAPLLYALYMYIPFAQRTYGEPVSLSTFLLVHFKYKFWSILIMTLRDSGIFLFVIGLLPLVWYSAMARRACVLFLILLILAVLFSGPSLLEVPKTIQKGDLAHFFWTLPFAYTVFVAVGFQELLTKRFSKMFYFTCMGVAAIFYIAAVIRRGAASVAPVNFVAPLVMGAIFLHHKMGAATMSGISRALKQLLLPLVIALALVAIVQFRMTRFGLENTPYRKLFDSHSTLSTLKEEEGGRPFRVGTLSMMPAVVQMYGAETVDGRGPLQPKYYKDYFREIIRPQLRKESYLDFFDNYWFHLYLRDSKFFQESADASNGELLLRIPLLLMINTKYLVSWNRDPYLEGVSEKVMEVKGDNIIKPSLMDRAMQKVDLIARIPILGAFVEQRLKRDGARSLFESVYCQTLFVYKLKGAFERGYLARNAIVLPSDREVLRSLTTKTQELVRGTVLFSAEDAAVANDLLKKGVPLGNNGKGDAVDIAYYSPDRIVFNGIASSPCFLVVTNNYHPNWSATVNGEKAKIYRANHAFQAISIEHVGKFRAVFEYNDPLLWKTHYAVPFGLALIWISVFYPRSNRKCEQDTPAL